MLSLIQAKLPCYPVDRDQGKSSTSFLVSVGQKSTLAATLNHSVKFSTPRILLGITNLFCCKESVGFFSHQVPSMDLLTSLGFPE